MFRERDEEFFLDIIVEEVLSSLREDLSQAAESEVGEPLSRDEETEDDDDLSSS